MSRSRCAGFVACMAAALGFIAAFSATAAIPQKISYQGRLIDNVTGEPRVGSHNMTFHLYDAALDGSELWSETHVVVADSAGVIGVILGGTVPINLVFDVPIWLEVEVAGEVLSPRRELVSVPYAFHALHADSLGGFSADQFVMEGELASITAEMIVAGTGSGLDADMVDGLGADAFSDTGHVHDDRYYTQETLSTTGTVNDTLNPVDWSKLKGVPAGFADGTDDVGEAADGYSLDADDGDPVDAVYIDAEGDVGIGTTDPEEKLDVAGTVKMEGFDLPSDTTYGYVLTSDSSGTGTWQAPVADGHSLDADDGDPVDALYVDEFGNVGLGTDDPSLDFHLHKAGGSSCQMLLTNDYTGPMHDDGLRLEVSYSPGNAYITNFEAADLNLGAGGYVATLTVDSDQKVGINEDEPNYELHVHRYGINTDCNMQMTNYTIGNTATDGLLMGINKNGFGYLTNQENGFLILGTNNQGRLAIASDGDVGIGTLNPVETMHLHDPDPSEDSYLRFTNSATGASSTDGLNVGINWEGSAYFWNYENKWITFGTNNNTRMRITSGGDVGIGDNNPKVKLAVTGVARIQNLAAWPTEGEGMELAYNAALDRGYIQVYDRDGGSWGNLSLGSGNVGIGTVDPAVKLEIKGDDPFIGLNTTNNKTGVRFQKNGTTEWEMAWNEGSGYLYLYNSGTRMVIEDATGDVGIGTVTPTSRLDVGGTAGHNQLRLRQSYTPTGTADPNGQAGDIAWDNNYVYVKTSGGWKRATLSTF